MCQNTKNMKITPVTDICSKGDFVKKRVLTHPLTYLLFHTKIIFVRRHTRSELPVVSIIPRGINYACTDTISIFKIAATQGHPSTEN